MLTKVAQLNLDRKKRTGTPIAPLKRDSTGYRHGFFEGVSSGNRTNLKFSDAIEEGVREWDQ